MARTRKFVSRLFRITLRYPSGAIEDTVLKVVFDEKHSNKRAVENTIADCCELGLFPKLEVVSFKAVSMSRVASAEERKLAV